MQKIWVVDDDKSIRWVLQKALGRAQIHCEAFSNAQEVLLRLAQEKPHVLVTDIRMPGESGLKLLHKVRQQYPNLPIIVMTAFSDLDTAVAAFQNGAFDYLPKPFELQYAIDLILRAMKQAAIEDTQSGQNLQEKIHGIIGQTAVMHDVICTIGRLSKSSIPVLITGDAGVGKRLFAKVLHAHSPKAKQPFVEVQLNAVPEDQLNSVLFEPNSGAIKRAHNGTLFLNNLGQISADVQTKLLNVFADESIRVIASTRFDLKQLVFQGRFSEHLYHRLNAMEIHIPNLKQRMTDLPLLVDYFCGKFANELNLTAKKTSEQALSLLSQYDFPGNVRQLENICRQLTVSSTNTTIEAKDLPEDVRLFIRRNQVISTVEILPTNPVKDANEGADELDVVTAQDQSASAGQWTWLLRQQARRLLDLEEADVMRILTDQFEAIVIEAALEATKGKRKEAAERLGIGRNTITRKISDFNLD